MAISKTLLYHCKDPEKSRVLLVGPTGTSTVNIDGTTIYSGLGIKLGTKLLGLNEKSKAVLRNRLLEAKLLIRDIHDDSWKGICWFISCDCSWLSSTTSSQRKTYVLIFFDKDRITHLLGLQLWHLFKYPELTEVVRKNYKLFTINLHIKIRLGNIDDDVEFTQSKNAEVKSWYKSDANS